MKVLVIEDDPGIIEVVSLCFQLRWSGTNVISAANGRDGVSLVETESPDVVILDIGLPDIDGYQVLKEIRRFSEVPVIMLTVRGEDTDVAKGLELGADDYITKPFSMRELLARIKAVLRRTEVEEKEGQKAAEYLEADGIRVDLSRHAVSRRGKAVDLNPKEFELLAYLMGNIGQVISREQALRKVWGYDYIGGARTVDVHIRWLRQKLEDDAENPQHLLTVRGYGYKFEV